jgi:zinc protease
LKPTDFKKDEISFNALALGGTSRASDADFYSALVSGSLASYSGLGELSASELERSLKGKSAGVSRTIGTYSQGLTGSSSVKDAETLLQLINLHFTGNRIDADGAAAALEGLRTSLADQEKDPETAYYLTVTETMSGRHPRFMRLKPVNLSAVDNGRALEFLNSSYRAGDFVFSFAGNIDPKAFRGLAETYLASIPQPSSKASWKDLGVEPPSGVDVTVKKGSGDKSLVTMTWFAPDAYTYPKFVRARALTELLDIRLVAEVRERLGGAYSVDSYAYYESIPASRMVLTLSFGCDPARIEELSAAAEAEIQRIRKGDVDPADLSKVKEILKNTMDSDFKRNDVWPNTLNQLLLVRKQPLDAVLGYRAYIDALTVADMAAAASLFEPQERNRVVLIPDK